MLKAKATNTLLAAGDKLTQMESEKLKTSIAYCQSKSTAAKSVASAIIA